MLGRKNQPKGDHKPKAEGPKGFDAFDLRLGDMMRGERATMGKSLLDVQRELKIKATYIAAVENCDHSVFETPGFIAGYVRSYARYLGMDPEWAYIRFCDESGFDGVEGASGLGPKAKPNAQTNFLAARPKGEDPVFGHVAPSSDSIFSGIEPRALGSIAVLLGLVSLIGYGGYSVLQEIQRVQFAPVDQSPGVVAEVDVDGFSQGVADGFGNDIATTYTPPTADALDRLYRPQVLEAPVLTARDGPIASLDPRSTGALVDEAAEAQFAEATTTSEPFENEIQTPAVQVVASDAPDVMIFATRPAWVRVASADGSVLFEQVLDKGETYVLPKTDEAPLLRAGMSGSVFFSVQGRTFGPAGQGTAVAKNVALGVDEIQSAYVEADITDPVLSETLTAMAEASVLPVVPSE